MACSQFHLRTQFKAESDRNQPSFLWCVLWLMGCIQSHLRTRFKDEREQTIHQLALSHLRAPFKDEREHTRTQPTSNGKVIMMSSIRHGPIFERGSKKRENTRSNKFDKTWLSGFVLLPCVTSTLRTSFQERRSIDPLYCVVLAPDGMLVRLAFGNHRFEKGNAQRQRTQSS